MAARLTVSVLVLVIVAVNLSQALRPTSPKKCCFTFSKPVSESRVRGYTFTHQQCTKAAVLLKMTKGYVCANPSERWVKDLINHLDSKTLSGRVSNI